MWIGLQGECCGLSGSVHQIADGRIDGRVKVGDCQLLIGRGSYLPGSGDQT